MAVAIVASIVERYIIIAKAFLGRFWALIFPGNRVAGGVRRHQPQSRGDHRLNPAHPRRIANDDARQVQVL